MLEGNIMFFIVPSTECRKRKMDAYGISSSRKKERENGGRRGRKRKNVSMLKITALRNLITDNITHTSGTLFH